jgi:hypothetical protein
VRDTTENCQEAIMKKLSIALIPLAFVAATAQAQDTGALPADQAVPPAAPEAIPPAADAGIEAAAAATEAAVTASAVSDTEVQSYAQAAVKVQQINANAALDQTAKQEQMVAAVTQSGLAPERFNEISNAIDSDTTLRAKVETAMAAHATAHQG